MTQSDQTNSAPTRTLLEVPCVTGVLPFFIDSGDGAFVVRDTNGAKILTLALWPDRGFVLTPAEGIIVEGTTK